MLHLEQVKRSLAAADQDHLLRFWPELSEEERLSFLQELSQLDLDGLRAHCEGAARAAAEPPARLDPHLEPLPAEASGSVRSCEPGSVQRWESHGELQHRRPQPVALR